MMTRTPPRPYDPAAILATSRTGFDDVVEGLRAPRKWLPSRLHYDRRGAELFEQLCATETYHVTAAEVGLLEQSLAEVSSAVGPSARMVEPGCGVEVITRRVLHALQSPAVYVPVDKDPERLEHLVARRGAEPSTLAVTPVDAEIAKAFSLPAWHASGRHTLVFFPSAAFGRLDPNTARSTLERLLHEAGPNAFLLLGADSTVEPMRLLVTYDDRFGATAAFNLNALAHLNRSRGADFDTDAFSHRAVWNASRERVELQLVSTRWQTVRIGEETIRITRGEAISTEQWHKCRPAMVERLITEAGWNVRKLYTSPRHEVRLWFCASRD